MSLFEDNKFDKRQLSGVHAKRGSDSIPSSARRLRGPKDTPGIHSADFQKSIISKMLTGKSNATDAETKASAETAGKVFARPIVTNRELESKVGEVTKRKGKVNFGGQGRSLGTNEALGRAWKLLEAKGIAGHAARLDSADKRKVVRAVKAHPKANRLFQKYRTEKHTDRREIWGPAIKDGLAGVVGGGLGGGFVGAYVGQPYKGAAIGAGIYGGSRFVGSLAGGYTGNALGRQINKLVRKNYSKDKLARAELRDQNARDTEAAKLADPKRLVNRLRFKFMHEGFSDFRDRAAGAYRHASTKAKNFASNPYSGEVLRRKIAGQGAKSVRIQQAVGAGLGLAYNQAKENHYTRQYKKVKGNSAEAKAKRKALAVKFKKNENKLRAHMGVGMAVPGLVHMGAVFSEPHLRQATKDAISFGVKYASNQLGAAAVKHVSPVGDRWRGKMAQANKGQPGFDVSGFKIHPRRNKTPFGGLLQATNEDRAELIDLIIEAGTAKVYGGRQGETVRELVQDKTGTNRYWRVSAPGRPTKFHATQAKGDATPVTIPKDTAPSKQWANKMQGQLADAKKALEAKKKALGLSEGERINKMILKARKLGEKFIKKIEGKKK